MYFVSASPAVRDCNLCGGPSSLLCPSCDGQTFCDACDDLYHRHPSRGSHKRDNIQKPKQGTPRRCLSRDTKRAQVFAADAVLAVKTGPLLFLLAETCSICGISAVHAQCSTCIQRLCMNCDRLFHSHPDRKGHSRTNVAPAKTSR